MVPLEDVGEKLEVFLRVFICTLMKGSVQQIRAVTQRGHDVRVSLGTDTQVKYLW